jgi:hypothetical protein
MDIYTSLTRAWDVIFLKETTMQAVAKDKESLTPALLIVVFSSFIVASGHYLFPSVLGGVLYRYDLAAVLLETLIFSITQIAFLYFTGFLAEKLFHSKLDTQAYVRVAGHGTLVNILGVIPVVSLLGSIWFFIIFLTILSKLGKLQVGSIILLVLLQMIMALFFGFSSSVLI